MIYIYVLIVAILTYFFSVRNTNLESSLTMKSVCRMIDSGREKDGEIMGRQVARLVNLRNKVDEIQRMIEHDSLSDAESLVIQQIVDEIVDTIEQDSNTAILWGLEKNKSVKGIENGAVVLFGSRSGARMNREEGDKVVKVAINVLK